MSTCSNTQYLESLPELSLEIKKQSQLPKLLQQIKNGKRNSNNSMGPVNSELRTIGKISRIIEMANKNDFHAFWLLDGLGTLTDLINSFKVNLSEDFKNSRQPPLLRVTVVSIQLYRSTCSSCKQISDHAILGGSIISLIDLLQLSLKVNLFAHWMSLLTSYDFVIHPCVASWIWSNKHVMSSSTLHWAIFNNNSCVFECKNNRERGSKEVSLTESLTTFMCCIVCPECVRLIFSSFFFFFPFV